MHLLGLADAVKEGVEAIGVKGMRFNTVGVSDGMSMGTEGMSFSLQSRDLIADSIETVTRGQWYDGLVTIPGCDKNMPGCLMAMGRINRPSVMVYGGTIRGGRMSNGQVVDIVNAFQSYGQYLAGSIDENKRGRDRAQCLSRSRCVRRHVHREHHGHRDRGDGHVAARTARPPRPRTPPSSRNAGGPAWWCAR